MKLVKFLLLGILCVLIVLFTVDRFIVLSGRGSTARDSKELPVSDVILVPGARIYAGEVSGVLARRLDAAILALRGGKSSTILVSGDYSSRYYDEAFAMRKYLLRHGINGSGIVLDHAGFSTYDSIIRARDVFDARSIIIASQEEYLPRALFIARSLGLQATGLVASSQALSVQNLWRERLARFKAIYDVLRHANPAFTGSGLPLDKLNAVVAH